MPFFVNRDTGEVIETTLDDNVRIRADILEAVNWEEVPAYEFLSPPEFSAPAVEIEDRSWVVDWYLRRKAEVEARIAARKAAYAAGMAEDGAVLRCLDWRYLDEVEHLAGELLVAQGGRKKSVTTTFGKVGWRKDMKVVIEDSDAAIFWLLERDENHEAVKFTPSILKKQLPAGAEIPGVRWPSGDVFFARTAKGT